MGEGIYLSPTNLQRKNQLRLTQIDQTVLMRFRAISVWEKLMQEKLIFEWISEYKQEKRFLSGNVKTFF